MNKIINLFVVSMVLTMVIKQSLQGEKGKCSWYGVNLDGALTASGEKYDGKKFTAAHKTLPFGTNIKVKCNGNTVEVRINDRGPFVPGRIVDFSIAAAKQVGIIDKGLCDCEIINVKKP